MVLTLRNLPRGFRATKRRSYPTAASVAAGSRTTTAADYKKWGYVTGYEADFSREVGLSDVAKGAIRIGSTASIYQSTAGAHASMLRAKAICHRSPFHFLSIGRRVGNEALLCSHPETLRGKPARAYVVVWRRGRFRGAIIATGLEGGASARQAVSLARVQNSRLHS
jgi:hypothetical protein